MNVVAANRFGRAPALWVGIALIVAALAVYYAFSDSFRNLSLWGDTAFIALVLMPAVFALVYFALPLRRKHGVALVAVAFGVLAVILEVANLDTLANFAKLATMTLLAFWFLTFFERLSWVVLVAALIPWIDAYSVWRGPTHHIVTKQRNVFDTLSFAFPVPGEHASANLGLPDLLFFALFLGRRGALEAARRLDLAGHGAVVRRDDGDRRAVGRERPAGAARDLDRLPRRERGSHLA